MGKFVIEETGEVYFRRNCTIQDRKNPVREFTYQGNKVGLNISVDMPMKFFDGARVRPVDIVCFNQTAIEGILKKKFKKGDRVVVYLRQTERDDGRKGLAIDSEEDIEKFKPI